jgi:D-lactate dehydrogenase
MAPFVRRQFGETLYGVMARVKELFDPDGLLAPGVLISQDPREHLRGIKALPAVDPAFDACVECGYCEPTCPAKDLTTTPRQRIGLERVLAAAPPRERRAVAKDFGYQAVDTCAADSLCAVACPVGIDTGKVMKAERAERHGAVVQGLGAVAARNWGPVTGALRTALGLARHVPAGLLPAVTGAARAVLPKDWVPQAGRDLPGPGPARRGGELIGRGQVVGVYFATCINSLFEGAGGLPGVGAALDRLCQAAGVSLLIPEGVQDLCCGTVWTSKGLAKGAELMALRTMAALWRATDRGRLPVVGDAASCSHGLAELAGHLPPKAARAAAKLTVLDAVTFAAGTLAPRLDVGQPVGSVAVHPTCSTVHLGAVDDLTRLAGLAGREVYVPRAWGCCAFAGDRGMLHPELTAAATRPEAQELAAEEARRGGPFDAYVSANRTCELGISRATGRPYVHVLQLLAQTVTS